jgi:hypothetical protein
MTDLAIMSSSSVRMTRTATRPPFIEISDAFSVLRPSFNSMPRKPSLSQIRLRTSGAFSPMPPAKTSVSNPSSTTAKEPIHFLA